MNMQNHTWYSVFLLFMIIIFKSLYSFFSFLQYIYICISFVYNEIYSHNKNKQILYVHCAQKFIVKMS